MEVDHSGDQPLGPVDIACLRIEQRTSLIVNAGAMVFAEALDFERVKDDLIQRFLCFRRFRQRLVWPEREPGTPRWEDDPLFDLGSHLHRVALPAPGSDQALSSVLSELISTPLERDRPLWQIHLIENFGDGCVLLFRLHHALADGMALMHVLRSMTSARPQTRPCDAGPAGQSSNVGRRARGEINPLVARGLSIMSEVEWLLYRGIAALIDSARSPEPGRAVRGTAAALRKLLFMQQDSPTVFRGPLGVAKRIAWSAPIPLEKLRAIARFHGGSRTEVLFAAVTGALRRYLLRRGQSVSDVTLRVSVPVDMRHGEAVQRLGNRFSLNLLALPIDLGDPGERVKVIRERLLELQRSSQADVMLGLMNVYGVAPRAVGDLVLNVARKKVTAVLSMVSGPARAISFVGKPIERMIFWVPQSGRLGLGVSLLAYQRTVTLGVVTDAGVVPDPESLARAFEEEVNAWIANLPLAARRAVEIKEG